MKRFLLLFATVAAVAGCAMAGDVKASDPKSFEIVKAGAVDDALVKRVQKWTEDNLAIPVSIGAPVALTKESLDKVGLAAAKALKPGDLGVVVLAWPVDDLKEQGVMMKEQRVAVVNVRAMKSEGIDDETFARRVERQAMRAIGVLTGMDTCPNPLCVLSSYKTLEQIDNTGRNFCPPCLLKFQQKMQTLGVGVDPKSPFNMIGTSAQP